MVRLLRFERPDPGGKGAGHGWGLADGDMLYDVTEDVGTARGAIHAYLTPGGLERLEELRAGVPPIPLAEVRYAPFLPDPEKIFCVGVNYPDRDEEYGEASARAGYPSLFLRTPGSFTGHGQPLCRPRESRQLDYEGEIVLVIGTPGRRIAPRHAARHIAGLTLMNEGTVRDWVRHGKFNVTQGKNFERSGSIGPWMVSADALDPLGSLALETHVNGERRQCDTTARMLFDIPYLIGYISTFTTLKIGDLISTGTPAGAGARLDPPRFLQPGDRVEVRCPAIGTLANGVEDD